MIEPNNIYNLDCIEGLKMMGDATVDLVLTDPPYEVNYNLKSKALEGLGKSREDQVKRDESFVDKIVDYDIISRELFRVLKNDTHCYLFCGDRQIHKWIPSMIAAGFKNPQVLVWKKNITTFDMTFGYKYPENKEFILFFQKGWRKLNGYQVERHIFRSILNFNSSTDTEYHSCAKPINLLQFLIKASSNVGDVCLDIFMGSGNHIIAMKRMNRRYIGFELSDVYFHTINRRLIGEKQQTTLMEVLQ